MHCAQSLHTVLHKTDLIIFPLTLQTIIIASMMSIFEGKGVFSSAFILLVGVRNGYAYVYKIRVPYVPVGYV